MAVLPICRFLLQPSARKPVALRDIHVEIMTKARPLRMIFQSFVALIAPGRLLREVRVFG
jgi:hypothetical protein